MAVRSEDMIRPKTWAARAQIAAANLVGALIGVAMFVGTLVLIARIIEMQEWRHSELASCLKNAETPQEYAACQ